MPTRRLTPLLATILAAAIAAPSVLAQREATPRVVHRRQLVTVAVSTPSYAACLAEVVYSGGLRQESAVKTANDGRVSWVFRVPAGARLGRAEWSVRCGVTWERSGVWVVRL